MKALAIDTAVSCIYIAVKNDDNTVAIRFDIGMKQAEKLLPAIDYVIAQSNIAVSELDYVVLTAGPGSFTGLRLGMSAAKAINLAYSIPIYPVLTLDAYAYSFRDFNENIIAVIDAKKGRFYGAVYSHSERICEPFDEEPSEIAKRLNIKNEFIAVGSDSPLFCTAIKEIIPALKIRDCSMKMSTTDALFEIAEKMIAKNEPPLKDYDGPFYIRKSEAEEKLNR